MSGAMLRIGNTKLNKMQCLLSDTSLCHGRERLSSQTIAKKCYKGNMKVCKEHGRGTCSLCFSHIKEWDMTGKFLKKSKGRKEGGNMLRTLKLGLK